MKRVESEVKVAIELPSEGIRFSNADGGKVVVSLGARSQAEAEAALERFAANLSEGVRNRV